MKMQMIKYLFPIIYALTMPAAAQAPEGDCTTPAQALAIAQQYDGVLYSDIKDIKNEGNEILIFKFNDGLFDVVLVSKGCVTQVYEGQTQEAVDAGLRRLGINKASE